MYFMVFLGKLRGTEVVWESKEMMEEEVDEDIEEIERERVAPGIEPTISEVEVEGANQCAMLSQTNLPERNGAQCLRRHPMLTPRRCNEIPTCIQFQRPLHF